MIKAQMFNVIAIAISKNMGFEYILVGSVEKLLENLNVIYKSFLLFNCLII